MAAGVTPDTQRGWVDHWMPGVRTLRTYERAWLARDLIAGVVLVTLLVPQGMAYAELAGLPAITGLYTTVICLVAYALVGPSPILVLGPDSSLGPMIAATILPLAAGSEETAIALAGMLALLVGLVTVGAGVAKLGFVADLLSNPVRTGYLAGLAIVIFIGQLPKLFGFSTDASGLVDEARAFVQGLRRPDEPVGAGDRPPEPGHHPGPQAALAADARHPRRGRRRDRAVDRARPRLARRRRHRRAAPGLSGADRSRPSPIEDIPLLFAAALGISLVAIGDTISTSGGFAARAGYEVNGNQELAGIGSANLAAGLFSGFPVSTSGSRTAVAFQSGAKTQLTGLVAAALVLLMLLFVPGLVQAMPQPVLAAVVIAASISLFDVAELRRLYRVRRTEFALAIACGLGVMFIGVLQGIVVAVVLSVVYIFKRAWAPYSAVLGKAPGRPRLPRHPALSRRGAGPGPAHRPLVGAALLRQREPVPRPDPGSREGDDPPPRWVLVAAEPITDIDTTAGAMLADLDLELNAEGIHLAFAELPSAVRASIVRYGLLQTVDEERLYDLVTQAVAVFDREAAPGAGRHA